MTPDHTATAALGIVESLLAENIDLHDAWIPIRRQDLSTVAFALKRAGALEANLANMLIMLNGAAPVIQPSATAFATPAADDAMPDTAEEPEPDTDDAQALNWINVAYAAQGAAFATWFIHLDSGNLSWRKLEPETQRTLILFAIATLHDRFGKFTGPLWDAHKPDGLPNATTLYQTMPMGEWLELAFSTFPAGPEAAGEDFRDE